jgi:tuberculosinol/isotuberculosinol synthase
MEWMAREQFLVLPHEELAKIVRASQTKVCVFPFNGTRRWFLMEHGDKAGDNFYQSYVEQTTQGYIQIFQLLFEHGIETILAPVFGSEILTRGPEYMQQIGASMGLLAEHADFLAIYEKYDVRVRFYGDYRREFKETEYAYITDQFDEVTQKTSSHEKHRLLYGVFASDATQSIGELSVEHYRKTRKAPSQKELVEAYYGEYIDRANIFIGFEKFAVFDYPMLNWGEESLYFTVAPSLYMTEKQLRDILYDHIYLRPLKEPDYSAMPKKDLASMRTFYLENRDATHGVGEVRNGIWYSRSNTTK